MKLSTKTRYALRAVLIIAQSPNAMATCERISTISGLSKKYLDTILGTLSKAKILRTERGVNGGYCLNRPSNEITVYDIFIAQEGSVTNLSKCIEEPETCDRSHYCPGRTVWDRVAQAMIDVMKNSRLDDLVKEEEELLK